MTSEYVQCVVDGFIDMVDMVIILMIGYAMQEVMYTMGIEGFVQNVCKYDSDHSPDSICFICILQLLTEFLYSLNYTLYQIELPVMIVVLTRLGANVPLCIGV